MTKLGYDVDLKQIGAEFKPKWLPKMSKAVANKLNPALKPGAPAVGCCGSLPPHVGGQTKGRLHVHATSLSWVHSIEPPSWTLAVRLRWWGEDRPGSMLRLPVKRGGKVGHAKAARGYLVTQSSYSITSSHAKFAAYLHDMQPLELEVGLGRVSDSSLCVGTATASNIKDLATQNSMEAEYPVVDRDGVVLARLRMLFHLEMANSPVRPPTPPQTAQPPTPPQGRTVRFDIPEENSLHPLSTNRKYGATVKGSLAAVSPRAPGGDSALEDTCGTPPTEGAEPGNLLYEHLLQKSHRLRESMVRSLLSSEDVWEGVERRGRDLEWEEEDDRGCEEQGTIPTPATPTDVDQTLPLPLGGALGCAPEGGGTLDCDVIRLVTDGGVGQWAGPVGGTADESDSEVDLTLSSESSSHPLHDQSLLDRLIYTHPTYPSDSGSEGEALPSAVVAQGEEDQEAKLAQDVAILEEGEGISDGRLEGEKEGTKGKAAAASGGRRRGGQLRSGLGRTGQLREGRILKLLGLERLTALGRVGAVRVEVGRLELDQTAFLAAHKDVTPSAYLDSVLFIEYHFPVTTSQTCHAQEVMRVASRKMAGTGVVSFNHCSLFPASFTRKVIFEWWQETVVFRVYMRLPQQRTPRLIGKSSMRLQSTLRAGGMELESVLNVHLADLSSAFSSAGPSQPALGTLTVKLQLIPKGGRRGFPRAQPPPAASQEAYSGDSPSSEDDGGQSTAPSMEPKVVDACPQVHNTLVHPPPRVVTLHLLLFIPEAVGLTVQAGAKEPPNGYVVCRLFCSSRPPPATDVVWSSSQPQFNHRLVFPLVLSSSLLTQLCNGVMVAEVWHKTAGTSTEDQLLGLVKVSLSQFHLAFTDDALLPSLLEAEYPVVAMDSYCPITNPLTASTHGHLGVILALGSSQQVSHLMQHYAGGNFLLRRPYPIAHPHRCHGSSSQQEEAAVHQVGGAAVGGTAAGEVEHNFEVAVESVRGLPSLNTAVWGEADCYVQYHFPGLSQQPQGEERASPQEVCPGESPAFPLLAHRTPTVLCIPDPVLDQSQRHTLPLPPGRPVQHVLLAAYPSHGVPFEVWKRFYYPNIRDQLVAKGHLPLAKLCALVTMRRLGDPGRGQPFSIPLTATGQEGGGKEGGVLHVRVTYTCEEGGGRRGVEEETASLITLSVGVLRACGLKEAAEGAAAEREPLLMAQPAREGVNAFVKLQLPQVIVKNSFETKAVARNFSPEFSHHFAIALPLRGGAKQALAEALQQSKAVFEVWHKVDRTAPQTSLSGGVTSRHLQRPPKEVLLGVTEVHLSQLLARETGIHGWLPVVPSPTWSASVGVGQAEGQDLEQSAQCLGGLELSLSFASKHHRQLVQQQASAGGWSPEEVEWDGYECVRWHLSVSWVQVSEDSVRYPTSSLHKLCYLRYKVYDRKPTVTMAHRAATVQDGRALYRFSHSAVTHIPITESLKWYLKEECLEVQVWLSGRAGHHRSRPSADDTLLGCCYIPLGGLSLREGDEGRVQGCYPLFKPGAASLGGGCVQVGLSLLPGQLAECKGLTHEMEISDSSEPPSTMQSSSPSGGEEKEVEEEPQNAAQVELQRQLEAANLFDATLHIHQAVPARDTAEGCTAAYAVVHPHPLVERIATPPAPLVPRPSWNHHSKTKIPRELLDPQSLGLQVQVWLKAEEVKDKCLGCATVDLSPLGYGMPLLSGWYNVVDFAGQCVGQLQVTVVPDAQLKAMSQAHPLVMAPLVYSSQSATGSRLPTVEASDGAPQLADKTTSFLLTHLRENMSELEELRDNWIARLKERPGDVEREELWTGNTRDHVTPAEDGGAHGSEGSMFQRHSFKEREEEGREEEGRRGFTGSVSQQLPYRVEEEEEEGGGGSDTPLSITPEHSESDEEELSAALPTRGCSEVEAHGTSEPTSDQTPPHHQEEPVTRQGDTAGTAPTQEGKDLPAEEDQPPLSEGSESFSSTSSVSGSSSSGSEDEGSERCPGTTLPSGQRPLTPTGDLVQGPRLPNFFLPPQALEDNMRALRLAALSRPPPVHPHPPPTRQVGTDHSSLVSTPERLEQSLEQLLRSYRQGQAARPRVALDAKETDRVARIFASKPNVS